MTANQINYQIHLENKRHNQEMERQGQGALDETHRANVTREAETNRSNVANEEIRRETNAINAASQREQVRHNTATENETRRSNIARESINWAGLGETARHNMSSENLQAAANSINYAGVGVRQQEAETRALEVSDSISRAHQLLPSQRELNKAQAQSLITNAEAASTNAATRQREADIAAYNAKTRRGEAIVNSGDKILNYVVPRKGSSNEQTGLGRTVQRILDEALIRKIEKGR